MTMTCPICPKVIVARDVVIDRVGAGLPLSARVRRSLEDSDFDSSPLEAVLAGKYLVDRMGEEQTRGTAADHLTSRRENSRRLDMREYPVEGQRVR